MIAAEAVREVAARLAAAGVDSPRVDAELLVSHALGVSRTGLYREPDREVPAVIDRLVERRAAREPLAYVLGEWGFRRLTLTTDARALVPRPETEILVERALALIQRLPEPRVLDLGTGSGAIALAVADEHPGARVTGVDISPGALSLARVNRKRTKLPVVLRAGGIDAAGDGWDLVVSNPPYVESLDGLQPELRFEPEQALLGEGFHRAIARAARTTWLALEVGDAQADGVAAVLAEEAYEAIRITPDLAGRPRVVEGRR